MENNTAAVTYKDLNDTRNAEEVAQFRSTWPNGNDPDGETTVVIMLCGSVEDGGFVLVCDDQNCGGSSREASEEIYLTREAAIAAAVAYAEEHNEE